MVLRWKVCFGEKKSQGSHLIIQYSVDTIFESFAPFSLHIQNSVMQEWSDLTVIFVHLVSWYWRDEKIFGPRSWHHFLPAHRVLQKMGNIGGVCLHWSGIVGLITAVELRGLGCSIGCDAGNRENPFIQGTDIGDNRGCQFAWWDESTLASSRKMCPACLSAAEIIIGRMRVGVRLCFVHHRLHHGYELTM